MIMHVIREFLAFWFHCLKEGVFSFNATFGFIKNIVGIVIVAIFVFPKLRQKLSSTEKTILSFVFFACVLFSLFEMNFIAPFHQYYVQSEDLNKKITSLVSSNATLRAGQTNEFRINLVFSDVRMTVSYDVGHTNASGQMNFFAMGLPVDLPNGIPFNPNAGAGINFDMVHDSIGAPVKISKLELEVVDFTEAHDLVGCGRRGEFRSVEYVCNLSTNKGRYECLRLDGKGNMNNIMGRSEFENVLIYPRCKVAGIFKFNIWIECTLGPQTVSSKVGTIDACAFFDSYYERPDLFHVSAINGK